MQISVLTKIARQEHIHMKKNYTHTSKALTSFWAKTAGVFQLLEWTSQNPDCNPDDTLLKPEERSKIQPESCQELVDGYQK
uniref:Uncharacterized protein n=1 Tax=Maylandia zebra TaxID=106582 RepID=A0A3P9CBX5_9CICH